MIDYVFIGSVPAEEDCAQVGEDAYSRKARKECRAYISLIKRHFESKGINIHDELLVIKSEAHDFGSYLEVACKISANDPRAEELYDLAYRIESESPTRWDEQALQELAA
jgi:hypothetical protein